MNYGIQTPVIVVDLLRLTNGNIPDNSITVGTTDEAYSATFALPHVSSFSIALKFSSGGVTAVTVELEQSNHAPTTEEADDTTTWSVAEDTDGASTGTILAVGDELSHLVNFAPVVSRYARLKLTGTGANAADTKLVRAEFNFVQGRR